MVTIAQNQIVPFLRRHTDCSIAKGIGGCRFSPHHHSHAIGPGQCASIRTSLVDTDKVEAHIAGQFQIRLQGLRAGGGEVGRGPVALVQNTAQVGGLVVNFQVAVREADIADTDVGNNLVITNADPRIDEVGVGGRPQ